MHAQQLHGAHDLGGQDLDGAVDALPAACHQAVEVGAADQGEPGPEGDGRHDVGAVHDAGVDADLGVRSDFTRDLGQQVEDRKSTRLNSSHVAISYAVFCLKKKSTGENIQ